MVRQYYPTPIANVSGTEDSASLDLILNLIQGINLVTAAEAIAFARNLQTDLAQYYHLVSNAAGASRVFNEKAWEMMDASKAAGGQSLDEAIEKLETVVQKARDMHVPLHLGNAALNVLLLARRRGLGSGASTGVVQVYDS